MDRDQYERELLERQKRHLEGVRRLQYQNWRPCLHDTCSECHGTGVRHDGQQCVHAISCRCPKCGPVSMSVDVDGIKTAMG